MLIQSSIWSDILRFDVASFYSKLVNMIKIYIQVPSFSISPFLIKLSIPKKKKKNQPFLGGLLIMDHSIFSHSEAIRTPMSHQLLTVTFMSFTAI